MDIEHKPLEKQSFGMGDSRSEKELQDQIKNMSDETLKKWAKNKSGMLGSKIAKLQDKLVADEMEKRGLNESKELDEGLFNRGEFNPDPFASPDKNEFAKAVMNDDLKTMERIYKKGELGPKFKVHNAIYRPYAMIKDLKMQLKSKKNPEEIIFRGKRKRGHNDPFVSPDANDFAYALANDDLEAMVKIY